MIVVIGIVILVIFVILLPILFAEKKRKEEMTAPMSSHDEDAICYCVVNHNPNPMELNIHHVWPLFLGGPDTKDNCTWLCPTTHTNVHELLREWLKKGEKPDYDILKRFSKYTQGLAEEGYTTWKNNQSEG